MMARKTSSCALCENSNVASICAVCVNYRLNEYRNNLKSLKSHRDLLYLRLSEVLVAKGKADNRISWRVLQNEKLARLREKLRIKREQYLHGKAKIEKISSDLKVKYELLDSAMTMLERNRVEQLEKFYPNLISTQRLGLVSIVFLNQKLCIDGNLDEYQGRPSARDPLHVSDGPIIKARVKKIKEAMLGLVQARLGEALNATNKTIF